MLQITTTPIETHRNIVLTERERMQTKLHALASMAVAAAARRDDCFDLGLAPCLIVLKSSDSTLLHGPCFRSPL